MKSLPAALMIPFRLFLRAAVLASLLLVMNGLEASAQGIDLSTNNVTVDLSVIGDSGAGPVSGSSFLARPFGGGPRMGLLVPGGRNPVSQLHVQVPGASPDRIKLRPPGTKKKKPAKRVAKKKVKKPKPAPAPVAASKPPAPLTAAKPPTPPEAKKPAEPEKTVAKAPPAPPSATPPAPPKLAKPEMKSSAPPAPPAPAAPAPATAAKPEPKPMKKEQAALPPPEEAIKPGQALRVTFGPTVSKLPADAKDSLKALAKKIKGKDKLRLQLMAFAGGKSLSASKARRMSLSRALSVRSFLIESGVRSTRIDVRALGSKTTEEPVNRVDVNIVER
ncbi:MAG: OmpA family protein [Rhodospirillales bacterium]